MKRLTNDEFIKRAEIIHGNKFDYSLTKYINQKTKVKIICPTHGEFNQNTYEHLNGSGCPNCIGKNKTTEYFIKESIKIHGNKYDYKLVNYINSNIKVKIICPIHGENKYHITILIMVVHHVQF